MTEIITATKKKERLFVGPVHIIPVLAEAYDQTFVWIPRLYGFAGYLRKQLFDREDINDKYDIVYEFNFDTIERTVRHYSRAFQMVNDVDHIYCRSYDGLPTLPHAVNEFVNSTARTYVSMYKEQQ
jgi:hypothetical protein